MDRRPWKREPRQNTYLSSSEIEAMDAPSEGEIVEDSNNLLEENASPRDGSVFQFVSRTRKISEGSNKEQGQRMITPRDGNPEGEPIKPDTVTNMGKDKLPQIKGARSLLRFKLTGKYGFSKSSRSVSESSIDLPRLHCRKDSAEENKPKPFSHGRRSLGECQQSFTPENTCIVQQRAMDRILERNSNIGSCNESDSTAPEKETSPPLINRGEKSVYSKHIVKDSRMSKSGPTWGNRLKQLDIKRKTVNEDKWLNVLDSPESNINVIDSKSVSPDCLVQTRWQPKDGEELDFIRNGREVLKNQRRMAIGSRIENEEMFHLEAFIVVSRLKQYSLI